MGGILMERLSGKQLLGGSRRRRKDDIKRDPREVGCDVGRNTESI
jgi:hypothetical protein